MKTALFEDVTGSIQPEVGVTTVTVSDFYTPVGLIITVTRQNDKVLVVRRNGTDTGWEPITDEQGKVYLSAKRRSVTLTTPDVYGLQGYVDGTLSAYVVNISSSLDSVTNAMMTVGYEHHEIHSGSHYFYEDHVTLAENGFHNIEIITPDTTSWLHMTFAINAPGPANFDVYEGANATTGGTAFIPINNNRNSTKVSGATCKVDVLATVPPGGTQIIDRLLGAEANVPKNELGGTITRSNEIILKQNTRYLFQLQSLAAGNNIDFHFNWYEHTNKN